MMVVMLVALVTVVLARVLIAVVRGAVGVVCVSIVA